MNAKILLLVVLLALLGATAMAETTTTTDNVKDLVEAAAGGGATGTTAELKDGIKSNDIIKTVTVASIKTLSDNEALMKDTLLENNTGKPEDGQDWQNKETAGDTATNNNTGKPEDGQDWPKEETAGDTETNNNTGKPEDGQDWQNKETAGDTATNDIIDGVTKMGQLALVAATCLTACSEARMACMMPLSCTAVSADTLASEGCTVCDSDAKQCIRECGLTKPEDCSISCDEVVKLCGEAKSTLINEFTQAVAGATLASRAPQLSNLLNDVKSVNDIDMKYKCFREGNKCQKQCNLATLAAYLLQPAPIVVERDAPCSREGRTACITKNQAKPDCTSELRNTAAISKCGCFDVCQPVVFTRPDTCTRDDYAKCDQLMLTNRIPKCITGTKSTPFGCCYKCLEAAKETTLPVNGFCTVFATQAATLQASSAICGANEIPKQRPDICGKTCYKEKDVAKANLGCTLMGWAKMKAKLAFCAIGENALYGKCSQTCEERSKQKPAAPAGAPAGACRGTNQEWWGGSKYSNIQLSAEALTLANNENPGDSTANFGVPKCITAPTFTRVVKLPEGNNFETAVVAEMMTGVLQRYCDRFRVRCSQFGLALEYVEFKVTNSFMKDAGYDAKITYPALGVVTDTADVEVLAADLDILEAEINAENDEVNLVAARRLLQADSPEAIVTDAFNDPDSTSEDGVSVMSVTQPASDPYSPGDEYQKSAAAVAVPSMLVVALAVVAMLL